MNKVKIIECPRDAMQGIKSHFISTEAKANYINSLLKVGFDTIDFGSFVSPKAIPQMRDTAAVLARLDLSQTTSKLLAIVANVRGAHDAAQFEERLAKVPQELKSLVLAMYAKPYHRKSQIAEQSCEH